ncbi:hypothetical protein KIPB_001078 [Kipferlia bialata]|uniref:t-SNARE coiled-coil homology domain-containing protein n=1 Tax=Kipferlia bialata TaxID=797122 RepID=A0A391NLM0_9EUKA|nr:hypothetical protein KIPB_001078 [Kipferlia bialata]|eukprot:g1078.t1
MMGESESDGFSGRPINVDREARMRDANDQVLLDLQHKAALLRDLTYDIGDTIRDQNSVLSDLGDEIRVVDGSLKAATVKLQRALQTKKKPIAVVTVCAIGVFIIGWRTFH